MKRQGERGITFTTMFTVSKKKHASFLNNIAMKHETHPNKKTRGITNPTCIATQTTHTP